MQYSYQSIYNIVNANGDLAPGPQTAAFTGTVTIDLTQYQNQVMSLDFREFRDTALSSEITPIDAKPSVEELLRVNKGGSNTYKPESDGGSVLLNGDRITLNASKDYSMLFGKRGVAIASPNQVNIDTGKSITLFGADERGVFIGIPNKGNNTKAPLTQAALGTSKGDPTPDQLYEPMVLGIKLANILEDALTILKNAEMASAVSVAKWQPSTMGEFALLANRIPEMLSTYAYVDGISHESIDTQQLNKIKGAQKKTANFIPPTQLSGSVAGTLST
jgi:hypothetical protein